MGDWKKRLLTVAGYFAFGLLVLLLLLTVVQGWKQKLDSRYWTTLGFVLIAGLSVLFWKKLSLGSRVQLLATYLIVLIGFCGLKYTPQAKTSFMIGPLSLAFLVNLLIFLSLSLALFFLLRGLKLSRGLKIGIGVFGLLCSIPFLIGLIKNIPLSDLLRGEGFVHFLPWFLQPSFLGVILLLPVLILFLCRDLFRSLRDPQRSALRSGMNLLIALVPLALGIASIQGRVQSGVVTRYFGAHDYMSLKKQDLEPGLALAWKSPPVGTASGDRFWVEWEGMMQIPKEGEYEFRSEGDGQGFLYIDGQRVFSNESNSGKVKLSSGKHSFRSGAIEEKKEGKFLVQWKGPNDKEFQAIDPKYLSYRDEQSHWTRSPRQAAQVGLDWLQSASLEWQNSHQCVGCHVQGQVLMGMTVAQKNDYVVNKEAYKALFDFLQQKQNSDGSYHDTYHVTATMYADMGMAFVQDFDASAKNPNFLKSVDWLLSQQGQDGKFENDHQEPPIDQGAIMATANSVFALMQAAKESGQDKYKQAAEQAMQWIATATPETTQDKIFKILALTQFGSAAQKAMIGDIVEQLKKEQNSDGGWKETPTMDGANAYATGQVLYAFKKAGVSINSAEFSKGVLFLLNHQKLTGDWPAEHTQTGRPSEFAPTMWAVIGLAGSFGEVIPEILEPKDKSSVEGNPTIKAQVTNFTDSEIKSVDFELDGKPLGSGQRQEKENLYTLPWNTAGLSNGEHKLRVVATNKAGKQGESTNTVYFVLGLQVKVTNPPANANVSAKQVIQAEAKGLYGQTIQKVEFFVGPATAPPGNKLGEQSENPGNNLYGMDWDPGSLPDGAYRLTAVATNSRGQQAQDSVVVNKRQPLSVKISSPANGQEVSGALQCVAQVTNNTAVPVDHVEFFLDGENSLGRSLSDKYEVPCNFDNVPLGQHTLKVVATNAQGLTATDSISITVGESKGPGYLKVQLKNLDEPNGDQVLYFPPDIIELVLDISGSMWEQIQGKAKIEIAREVLAAMTKTFPKDANLALRVYGHRSKSDCKDTELLIPPGKIDPAQVVEKFNSLKPKGMTLIDYSLREALKDLQPVPGSKVVILVTDGIETCKGDPVKAAQDMIAAGLKMKIDVVGFNISHDPAAVEQLKKVAETGQGKFFSAENSQELSQALTEAVKVTYSVYDEQGKALFLKPLSLESNELMSGTYRIEVALDPPLVLSGVKVEKGKTTVVDVIRQNKAFRIESPQASGVSESAPQAVPPPPKPESLPAAPESRPESLPQVSPRPNPGVPSMPPPPVTPVATPRPLESRPM